MQLMTSHLRSPARKQGFLLLLLISLFLMTSCGEPRIPPTAGAPGEGALEGPKNTTRRAIRRVIMMNFDGADPDLIDLWKRELPALSSWIGEMDCSRIATTNPPDVAVAWSSVATGRIPAHHGIHGKVARDPRTYLPVSGVLSFLPLRKKETGDGLQAPSIRNLRQGSTLWSEAIRQGLSVRGFFLPYALPAEKIQNGAILAGIGVPDLRLSESTFTLFDTAPNPELVKSGLPGGVIVRLESSGVIHKADIEGPYGADGKRIAIPISFDVDIERGTALANGGSEALEISADRLSGPVTYSFPTSNGSFGAKVRFLLLEATSKRVRVYMSPLMMDPASSYFDFSSPPARASQLAEASLFFRTAGWSVDTSAYDLGILPEEIFWNDLKESFDEQYRLFLGDLTKGDSDLVIASFNLIDLTSHFTFSSLETPKGSDETESERARGRLLQAYKWMDEAVGRIQPELKPEDTLIVFSTHGMNPWLRTFNVNTWLMENGYLRFQVEAGKRDRGALMRGQVDWSRTRAYSVGPGQIYLNLRDRERDGIVPMEEAQALLDELAGRLVVLKDPEARETELVRRVVKREPDTWLTADREVDLRYTLAPGYQNGPGLERGMAARMFEANTRRWSADHVGSDARDTEGMMIGNLPGFTRDAQMEDLAPTVLARLALTIPSGMDGQDRVQEIKRRAPSGTEGSSSPETKASSDD